MEGIFRKRMCCKNQVEASLPFMASPQKSNNIIPTILHWSKHLQACSNSGEKDIDHFSVEEWQRIRGYVLKLTHGFLNSLYPESLLLLISV